MSHPTKNIKDIMQICNVSENVAYDIYFQMCGAGIDFSECTNKEFTKAAKEAHQEVQENAA